MKQATSPSTETSVSRESKDHDLTHQTPTMEDLTMGQDILKSDKVSCVVCGVGKVKPVTRRNEKKSFVIDGRNGVWTVIHVKSRCNNRNKYADCRAGYYHGYITHKGLTVFEDYALKQKFLVTSNQSGF